MADPYNDCTSTSALLTDLYELTMAYGYWKTGMAEREAVYNLFYRTNPFGGGFCVACGLDAVIDYLSRVRFTESDIDYLAGLRSSDGSPVFETAFLDYLAGLSLVPDVDGVPEGTVVFPHEPLLRVTGPLIAGQIIETALLNIINFQTLIATKASRVCLAAESDSVLEFGLRRAQGHDGGLSASRAAYIGGCAATSNVLAGKRYGIPVKGTHAHSWVMAFDSEEESFRAYADAMPGNCIFLVDTYDTITGVRNAVTVGKRLRERGYEMIGIRLDSGDPGRLGGEARKILDGEGFENAAIVASGDLDEYSIAELKKNDSPISVWGVGTRLVTGYGDPALGGVYKLAALRGDDGGWEYRIKLSEEVSKMTIPGILQVRRFRQGEGFVRDVMYDAERGMPERAEAVDISDPAVRTALPADGEWDDVLVPVFRAGEIVYERPSIGEIRSRALAQVSHLDDSVRRLDKPARYPVGLERGLHDMRDTLVRDRRSVEGET